MKILLIEIQASNRFDSADFSIASSLLSASAVFLRVYVVTVVEPSLLKTVIVVNVVVVPLVESRVASVIFFDFKYEYISIREALSFTQEPVDAAREIRTECAEIKKRHRCQNKVNYISQFVERNKYNGLFQSISLRKIEARRKYARNCTHYTEISTRTRISNQIKNIQRNLS